MAGKPEPPPRDDDDVARVRDAQKENLPWEDLKEVLLLAITSLQSKNDRYREYSDQLIVERDELRLELEKRKEDEADIHDYLERELAKTQAEFKILDQKAVELARQKDEMEFELRTALEVKTQQYEATIRELRAKIDSQGQELNDVQLFREQKAALEKELEETRQQLEVIQKQHAQKLRDVERQAELDRDKIINQMYARIKQTKEHFLKMTDDQIDTITKRTILENEQMSAELAYQSKQTRRLIQQNDKLKEENAVFRREIDLLKQQEGELAKKNTVYQKTIKTLLSKIKSLDADQREVKGSAASERDQHILALEEFIKSLELKIAALEAQLERSREEAERQRGEVAAYEKEMGRLMSLQDEAEQIILASFGGGAAGGGAEGAPGSGGGGGGLFKKGLESLKEAQEPGGGGGGGGGGGDSDAEVEAAAAAAMAAEAAEAERERSGSAGRLLPGVAAAGPTRITPRTVASGARVNGLLRSKNLGTSSARGHLGASSSSPLSPTGVPVRVSRNPGGGGRARDFAAPLPLPSGSYAGISETNYAWKLKVFAAGPPGLT